MNIEFFFDCSSPWTYLAFEGIIPLAAEYGAEISWRPVLVGGIFNAVNSNVHHAKRAGPKWDYHQKDLQDWARQADIIINFPPPGHPVNSVKIMRACVALVATDHFLPFVRTTFQAYHRDHRWISDDSVIRGLCELTGVDADWLFEQIAKPSTKEALRANGDEAVARGAFGSPTYFLDRDDIYFGVDRLPLLRAALERKL